MFYTADNAKLQINGNEILASNASISLSASLQPNYTIVDRSTVNYVPSNGIGGKLDFSYYITGRDYLVKSFITGQGEIPISTSQVISGNFGGLFFDSGYLNSYSINFSPNAPAIATASISFFDDLEGEFHPTTGAAPTNTEVLNFERASISQGSTPIDGEISDFVAGTYNYSSEVKPVYLMGETKPSSVSFGPKTTNMNFEVDNPTGFLPVSGADALISVDLKNIANVVRENFACSGVIQQRSLAGAVQDYVKHSITIVENSTQAVSTFVAKIIDNVGGEGCVGIGTTSSEGNI